MFADPVSFTFGLFLLAGIVTVAYLIGQRVRSVELGFDPGGHVRLAGVRRRCVRCKQIRPTMDLADGWGSRARSLPYCGPCCRDLMDVEHGDGEGAA